MGTLAPEFLYDVFMSYSHGDVDKTGDALLKDWSEDFHARLQSELRTLPDWPDASVFVDDGSLDRSDPLEEQIKKAVLNSALFLILMSPHYLISEACRRERQYWLEKVKSEYFPEVRSRALVARVWPLRQDDVWPTELCDERGQSPLSFWFHEQPGDPDKTRPFGWTDRGERDFRDQLVELAGEIAGRFRALKKSIERKREAAANIKKLTTTDGLAIYVYGRRADSPRWENACRLLTDAGYVVVPDKPEPFPGNPQEIQEIENEGVRTLTGCDGLLLVPGDNPTHLSSDLVVVGRSRRNSVRATTNKLLPCAVLDFAHMGDANPRCRLSAEHMNIRWINALASNWVGDINSWLTSAATAAVESR